MATKINPQIAAKIEDADTPAKVWELVLALTGDANGYSPETYLDNVKAWTEAAIDIHHGLA